MPGVGVHKPWIDTAAIVARYRAGETLQRIAEALGCSTTMAKYRLRSAGVELRPPGKAPLPLDDAELERLYLSGLTLARVARQAGCSEYAVQVRLRRRGTPMRPPGRRRRDREN